MATKTLSLNGTDYTVAPITVLAAKTANFSGKGMDFNVALVAASLRSGGDSTATTENVEALPFFGVFSELLTATMEVNGLKMGEAQPGGPAASTSSTSTEA